MSRRLSSGRLELAASEETAHGAHSPRKVWKFGDNMDADSDIIPFEKVPRLPEIDADYLAQFAMTASILTSRIGQAWRHHRGR